MKMKISINRLAPAFASVLLVAGLCSCSHEKHGEVVRDSKGNYYELNGNNALGVERYLLKKIDTTKYKPVGFEPCH